MKFKQLCGGGKGRHTRKQIVAKHSGSSPACNFCIGKGMAIL
nr:MAG TPA: hypothetical protein [Caudoviricetes sp.]